MILHSFIPLGSSVHGFFSASYLFTYQYLVTIYNRPEEDEWQLISHMIEDLLYDSFSIREIDTEP